MNRDKAVSMKFRMEVANLFNVLATPVKVSEEIRDNTRCRMPLMFSLASSLIIGYLMIPASEQILRGIYRHSFGPGDAGSALSPAIRVYFFLGVLIRACAVYIRWALCCALLYLLTRLVLPDAVLKVKPIFCMVAYAEIIFIAMAVLTLLILYAQGLERIESSGDLVVFKGVDDLLGLREDNPRIASVLSNINIFSLWYILVVSAGLRVLTGMKKFEALAITSIAWLCWSLLSVLGNYVMEAILKLW